MRHRRGGGEGRDARVDTIGRTAEAKRQLALRGDRDRASGQLRHQRSRGAIIGQPRSTSFTPPLPWSARTSTSRA
jgi:hypothetical protein